MSIVLLFASCGPSRELTTAQSTIQQLRSDSERQAHRIYELNQSANSMQNDLSNAKSNLSRLEDARKQLQQQLDATRADAAGRLNASQQQVNLSQQQIADQQRRLEQLQALINQQRNRTEELRKKMAAALVNFNSNELSIRIKDGKVYVSLQESLLFPSGSAVVNPKGRDALGQLASVLQASPDINVNIEGHTDSIPIKDARYEDNWALSVARATSIVRVLTNGYKLDPERVTASGKSRFDPVDVNYTAQGRANNRRTEIILEPKLDELLKLIREQ